MAQIALVTGGNRGIGLEVCRQLAERGYTVILGSRDPVKGERAAQAIEGEVVAKKLEVTSQEDVDALARWVESEYGRLDALVNNAAIDYDQDQGVLTADLARVRRAFDTNTLGPWRMAQAFAPLLRKSEHPRLVNVSSGAGSLQNLSGGTPAYSLSKAALNALTIMLADQLKGDGVLVNAVGPGWTATDMGGGGRPVSEGAASVVWAVILPDDGPTGGFFRDGERVEW